MKNKLHIAILMALLALVAFSCNKDPAVNIETFEITKENMTIGAKTVNIMGTYSYSGTIDGITVYVADNEMLSHAFTFPAELGDRSFSVELTGLQAATTYHYYYSVDYGFSKPYKTDVELFVTASELPTVQILDVLPLDSTTFRVKCEVLENGGQEVTERGLCWNTYGDPTLDDEILQHAQGGLGQYTIRMEELALGKKYYVRAYARNATGVGLSEESEFETPAPPGMPVNIELACNPEDGGSVSGGGTYPVGTQCTVMATANAGYTFVNWTENGNQVSTDATYTFIVTRECHLVANFTTQAYVITAEVTPENSGTVTGAGGYSNGEQCALTATAKPGYEFVKWTKNGTSVSTNASFTFTVTASATYVAHFQTKSYTVTVTAQPSNGGAVTGGGTYNYGQSCTVHAAPAEGCNFINWTDDGDIVSAEANYSFTVTGNRILVANFTHNGGGGVPTGAINGLFTVNESGDQVCFSQGNLQYQASTNTWRFAENQWDYVGDDVYGNVYENGIKCDNSLISSTYFGWIDLFGWGTSGYDHGAVCYQPWSTSVTNGDYYAYGVCEYNLYDQTGKADWGYNSITNGGNQENQWRTLSDEEWSFVLFERGTASGGRFAKAIVNNIEGVILLPDNWNHSYYFLNNCNQCSAAYNSNIFSIEDWNTLTGNGLVFLPASGNRIGLSYHNPYPYGYYWSSSYVPMNGFTDNAIELWFSSNSLNLVNGNSGRCIGCCVRLVQDN